MNEDYSIEKTSASPRQGRAEKTSSTRRVNLALWVAIGSAVGWIALAVWGSLITAPMFEALNYTSSSTEPTATIASEFRAFLMCLVAILLCAILLSIGLVRFTRHARREGGASGFLSATARIAIIGPAVAALSFLIFIVVSAYTVVPAGY
jgi:hypothetical protein